MFFGGPVAEGIINKKHFGTVELNMLLSSSLNSQWNYIKKQHDLILGTADSFWKPAGTLTTVDLLLTMSQ